MKFGLRFDEFRTAMMEAFVAQNSHLHLEVLIVEGYVYVTRKEEFESLDAPGAVTAVRQMMSSVAHMNYVDKAISVIDTATDKVEDHLEHIRRLHKEAAVRVVSSEMNEVPGLAHLRSEGGHDHEMEGPWK